MWLKMIQSLVALMALCTVCDSYQERVFNGETADLGMLPHQARIIARSFLSSSLCGGSLISTQYLISAAHCFYPKTYYRVDISLGLIDSQGQAGFTSRASSVVVHPNYRSRAFRDDIAVVKMRSAVTPSKIIAPAALPSRAGRDPTIYNGEQAIVSGWGETSNGSPASRYLQYQTVQVMDHARCQRVLFSANIGPGHLCTDKVVYAGPCSGDSGGPLTLNSEVATVIGVTSFITGPVRDGEVACENNNPAVYANTAYYLDFIAENTDLDV